jgi:NRPS condensation-like uncharacterized protein
MESDKMNGRELGVCELACQLLHDDFAGWGLGSLIVKASGPFSKDILYKALKQIYAEQPLLRARIRKGKKRYFFELDVEFEDIPIDIISYDSSELPLDYYEKEFDDLFPSEKYLWRFKWFKPDSKDKDSFFIFSFNHVLAEGGSAYIIFYDLLHKCKNIYGNIQIPLKPFEVMPKLEEILPDSPTYEEYISNQRSLFEGGADDKTPASLDRKEILTARPFDEYAPIGERRTHCVFHLFHETKLKKVIKFCKKHEITVNDLLNAILLKNVQENNDIPVAVSLETPINLKKYCSPVVSDKYFGLYIGVMPVSVTVFGQEDVLKLARSYRHAFELEFKSKAYYFPQSADVSDVVDNIICENVMKEKVDFAYSFMITNMGKYDFSGSTPFTIKEAYIAGGRGGGDQIMLVAVTTINDTMNLSFSYSYPLLSDENASDIINSFMHTLNSIQ